MALSKNSFNRVAKPRIYLDIIEYAKAIGYVKSFSNVNQTPINGDNNYPNVFNYNPTNVVSYIANGEYPVAGGNIERSNNQSYMGWNCKFKNWDNENRNWAMLLKRINYVAVLGHNMQTCDPSFHKFTVTCKGSGGQTTIPTGYTSLVGNNESCGNGYTVVEIDKWNQSDPEYFESFNFNILSDSDNDEYFQRDTTTVNIGAVSAGMFYDFPHNTDIDVKINYNYDGIKSKNTISGRTLTNVNYYKSPDWGNYPKWTHIPKATLNNGNYIGDSWLDDMDMKPVNATGRRSYDVNFSFLSKSDTFNKSMEGNMFAYNMENNISLVAADTPRFGVTKDNLMTTLNVLSLGGNIPFLFQPDSTKQEFVKVKLNQKNLSITQTAPELYSVKLRLTEVW